MNKFTVFTKNGGCDKEYLHDYTAMIGQIFDDLSTALYCEEIEIFHIAIRVDGKFFVFGDKEGCNTLRLFRKQGYIANSISFGENIWSSEKKLHDFLRSNLSIAFQQMINKLQKEKIHVRGDLLLKDLSKAIELRML